jgi:hypothetical protein
VKGWEQARQGNVCIMLYVSRNHISLCWLSIEENVYSSLGNSPVIVQIRLDMMICSNIKQS